MTGSWDFVHHIAGILPVNRQYDEAPSLGLAHFRAESGPFTLSDLLELLAHRSDGSFGHLPQSLHAPAEHENAHEQMDDAHLTIPPSFGLKAASFGLSG